MVPDLKDLTLNSRGLETNTYLHPKVHRKTRFPIGKDANPIFCNLLKKTSWKSEENLAGMIPEHLPRSATGHITKGLDIITSVHYTLCRLKHSYVGLLMLHGSFILLEPTDIWRYRVSTAHEVANWRKDEPINQTQPWTYVPRRVHVNSEMTRYPKA